MEKFNLTQTGEEVQRILNTATPQSDLTTEIERAQGAEQILQGNIDEEELRAKAAERDLEQADGTLQGNIDAEELRAKAAEQANRDLISGIQAKIPSAAASDNQLVDKSYVDTADASMQSAIEGILALIPQAATALNQLADKAFVNSSIATNTGTFKGTYNVVLDLEIFYDADHAQIALMLGSKIISAKNNDYCYVQVPNSNETPTSINHTDRYKFNGSAWAYEYTLNNSGFTSAQWFAINSGITELLKNKLVDLPTATELAALLAAKQNQLTFDTAPASGSTNPVTSEGIHAAIDNEKERAITAEETLQENIDGEETRAQEAESTLQDNIDTEHARALAAEQGLLEEYEELYALYQTLQGGNITPVAAADWPLSNLQQNVIYRVANSATPTGYSDYMYNGTNTILLAEFSFPGIDDKPTAGSTNLAYSGGIHASILQDGPAFDLSAHNAVGGTLATYADLNAALTALNALPDAYKKGGMSFKFIQLIPATYTVVKTEGVETQPTGTELQSASAVVSGTYNASQLSDFPNLPANTGASNAITYFITVTVDETTTYTTWVITKVTNDAKKYAQCRLMLSTFTAAQFKNTANWQGVDDEPAEGSQNFVKSGGVYKMVGGIGVIIEKKNISVSDGTAFNGYINTNKEIIRGPYWTTTMPIYCPKDTLIIANTDANVTAAPIARVAGDLSEVYDICVVGEGGSAKKYIFLTEIDGWYCCRGTNVHIITSDGYIKEIVNNLRNEIENGIISSSRVEDPNTGEKVEDTINSIGVHYSKLNASLKDGYIMNTGVINPNSSFLMSETPFYCNKGTLIRAICRASNGICVIAKTDDSLTSPVEKVCVLGADADQVLTYTYLVEESGYYACSSYKSTGLIIELVISNNYIKAITDDIYKKINLLPAPNTADFSLTDWQTKIPLCYLFHNPIFCGASTFEGHIVSNSNETQFSKVLSDYSMPSAIGRILSGWNVSNVSKSAITIKNWITEYFTQADFASHDLAFMGFGWNEPTPTTTIDEDVNQYAGDYTRYADTIYGNYCKLIEMAKEVNPNLYIVLIIPVGLSRTTSGQTKVDAIYTIAEKYNIPVINLNDTTYMTVPVSTRDYIHNTPMGYIKSAQFIVASFARICETNIIGVENTIYAANV